MVTVRNFCIDRFEAAMVDRKTDRALSPYYPPHPKLLRDVFRSWELERGLMGDPAAQAMPLPELPAWQKNETFEAKAVSVAHQVPQGYVSYWSAKRACENAGKRLCSLQEWTTACRGERNTRFPYGDKFDRALCNVWGHIHPAFVLHGNSSVGHRDPRLNLVARGGDRPLLRRSGATPTCASRWSGDAVYDMVGNLDEWIDDEKGRFMGGFYARSTSSGCEAQVASHAPAYHDYSTGVRCCKNP